MTLTTIAILAMDFENGTRPVNLGKTTRKRKLFFGRSSFAASTHMSRDFLFSDHPSLSNCLESPQDPVMSGAIEYLTDYSDSELSNRTPNGRHQNRFQSGWNGRSFISNNGSFSTCFSSRSTTPTTPFNFEIHRNSTASTSSLDVPMPPPGPSQYEMEVEPYLTDNFERSSRRRMRQLTAERLPQLETTSLTRSSIPQESPKTDSSEATLMSPLSCTHGKDSGYLSLSYNFLSPPESIPAVIPEMDTEDLLERLAIEANDLDMVPDSPPTPKTDRDRKRLSESTLAPSPPAHSSLPPPVPPRFPEIDAQAFDTMVEDTPDIIVYVPHEPMDAMSGSIDLPPIVAATIVKLIEKLTHLYGMGKILLSKVYSICNQKTVILTDGLNFSNRFWIHGRFLLDLPPVHVASAALQVPDPTVPLGLAERH